MSNEINTSLPSMAYILQSHTSSYNEKILALRSLKYYLDNEENNIDIYNKINIKQLILDNVLKIILNEDKTINIVKRKLIRTELFLILAKILDSNTLFGEILKSPDILHEVDVLQSKSIESSQPTEDESVHSLEDYSIESMLLKNSSNQNQHVSRKNSMLLPSIHQENSMISNLTTSNNSIILIDKMKHITRSSSASNFSKIKSLNKSHNNNSTDSFVISNTSSDTIMSTSLDISLLKPSLAQDKVRRFRSKHSKTWKPRPSVLFAGNIQKDSFVPGVDPLNYIEQDRKLGYQKPRMWFPHNNLSLLHNMVPDDRSSSLKKNVSGSEQVVKEFLQMRALASYVGDLVAPFIPSKESYLTTTTKRTSTASATKSNANNEMAATIGSKRRLANVADHKRFTQAVTEISNIWSPLLGVHLPPHHQAKYLSLQSSQSKKRSIVNSDEDQIYDDRTSSNDNSLPYGEDIRQPFKVLRGITGGEGNGSYHTGINTAMNTKLNSTIEWKESMIDNSKDIMEDSSINYMTRTTKYQEDIAKYLQLQRKHALESIKASEALIAATMKFQYMKVLSPKYLLVIEGDKANQRKLLVNAFVIFCRVKRLNLLTLVFGIWKIQLVVQASKARLPFYARIVSCHLMARWYDEVSTRKLRLWVVKWRRRVRMLIFIERNVNVILLQKLYRTWRDRRKFVHMHMIKPYLGVLSDIYLAPKRNLIFFIPDIIRDQRRFYWGKAIRIQTVFRCWLGSRDYFYKRRMLVLIQSVCRMFPVYRKFRRLRRITIKCQAWSRRTIKTIQYKRLKICTIIVQKYTRRYLSTLLKWRIWYQHWKTKGIPIAKAIMIQCRWRIHVARKVIHQLKFKIKLQSYAALLIQRNYFRYRKAFHTFFLMCALRQREQEDLKLEELATTMGKYYASRVIIRFYKVRFYQRIIKSVWKVQSWYRGRMAHIMVTRIRRERWAGRKLRHWGRCKVKRRRILARKIQRWWWLCKKGRMMRHLWIKAALLDKLELYQQSENEYKAAGRIQAYVKGVWDRRFVRRLRAVLIIQKNARFYFGLKRWRRWKLDKIRKTVKKMLDKVMNIALRRRTDAICKIHSQMLCKPQAIIRGILIRSIFAKARSYAYKVGLAVVTIQRCWRKSGAISKAVEEILVLKRRNSNPFKDIDIPHEIIIDSKNLCSTYYSSSDPRVGLKLSGLLYRLGLMELLEVFPKKSYTYVFDLTCLTIKELSDIYTNWKTKVERAYKNNKNKASKQIENQKVPSKMDTKIPIEKLQLILDIAQIPKQRLEFLSNSMKEKIHQIRSLPEYYSPYHASEMIKKNFGKKYGKNLTTKADRIASEILDWSYGKFNNYKTVGLVLTRAQILKAIAKSTDANQVLEYLTSSREEKNGSMDENKWDKIRISKALEILQYAIDKLDILFPKGHFKNMIEDANHRLLLYKRKMTFIKMKLTEQSNEIPKHKEPKKTTIEQHEEQQHVISNLNINKSFDTSWTVFDTLDLHYLGTLEDLELEYNISICKVYGTVLDKLHLLTCAIQSMKNSWNNKAMKRAMKKERTHLFLTNAMKEYQIDRNTNKVKNLWDKNRKIETYKKRMAVIMESVRYRKEMIEYTLSFIPKCGWVSNEDYYGYTYWMNTNPRNVDAPVYDMPKYTYLQWLEILKIQVVARRYLSKLYQIKLDKQEQDRLELERITLALEEERLLKEKLITIKCSIFNRMYTDKELSKKKSILKVTNNKNNCSQIPSFESLLPWKYQFEINPKLSHGMWVLFQSAPRDQVPIYEIVIMFRINEKESLCDVRTVKGLCYRNVKLSRIYQMNLDVGTPVETRYQYKKHFYRSTITYINNNIDNQPLYNVKYDDDNEMEYNMKRDAIRPSYHTLVSFLEGRKEHMTNAKLRYRRLLHFMNLRKERMKNVFLSNATSTVNRNKITNENDTEQQGLLMIENGSLSLSSDIQSSKNENNNSETNHNNALIIINNENVTIESQSQVALMDDNSIVPAEDMIEKVFFKLKLKYSRICMVYNWEAVYDTDISISNNMSNNPKKGIRPIYYINTRTNEISDDFPEYSAIEFQMAQKIQLTWFKHSSKNKIWKKILSINILDLISDTINKSKKIGFIGYELEGVTSMQILRRTGFWEIADLLENQYKIMKLNIQKISIEDIMKISKDDYEKYGIIQTIHIKAMKEFQTWWNKTNNIEKQKKLALFNYYKDEYDQRTIQECIQDSEELLLKKFSRVIKTGSSKTKQALQVLLTDAYYPHANQQIETYLKKYGDKPELARDSVPELINKPTTHTWIEENEVLKIYQNSTRIISAIFMNLRFKVLHKRIATIMKTINIILEPLSLFDKNVKRLTCSGPEAKAALLLRKDILFYFNNYINQVILIQKNYRCYLLHKIWKLKMKKRHFSIALLQRIFRMMIACKAAKRLHAQKTSEWEQLWDSRRNLLYYYNYITGVSQYNEPNGPFRPLIRDYYSAQLIQAWPEIDNHNGQMARLPSWAGSSVSSAIQSTHAICGICKIRKCVRICMDCIDEIHSDPMKYHAYPYCFPCYMKNHTEDNEDKLNHQFQVIETTTGTLLSNENNINNNSFRTFDSTIQSSTSVVEWGTTAVDQQLFDGNTIGGGGSIASSYEAASISKPVSLQCCMCDRPATRKCLGLLDEEQIEDICLELNRSDPDRWLTILQDANVAGERKLALLLEQIRIENQASIETKAMNDKTKHSNTTHSNSSKSSQNNKDLNLFDTFDNNNQYEEVKEAPKKEEVSSSLVISNENQSSTITILTKSHLQDIRLLLERTRAECDECYCQIHYDEVHTGGKRKFHRWKGFCESAMVCTVCNNSPAEVQCQDCDCQYCASCYKVFHSMGRKRLHKKKKILEELGAHSDYCYVCERRPADNTCVNIGCKVLSCDSCFLFKHKPSCDKEKRLNSSGSPSTKQRPNKKAMIVNSSVNNEAPIDNKNQVADDSNPLTASTAIEEQPATSSQTLLPSSTDNRDGISTTAAVDLTTSIGGDIAEDQCVVCGELADRRCTQCRDCYCSIIWPGNPGCFKKHHAKGNRLSHQTEKYFSPKYLAQRARERKKATTKMT